MKLTRSKGKMYTYQVVLNRSRGPQGEPPFSNIWMFLKRNEKSAIMKKMLNSLEELYGIKFFDPIRNPDFYYKFTHFEPGLYIFGDNGLLVISREEFYMYDLSMSDVVQGFFRRDKKGNNLQWFMRLTKDFDLGASGDPLTTIWNIEGQLLVWRWFINTGRKSKIPLIKDFIDYDNTFLGHFWDKVRKIWRSTQPHFTRDNATGRKGFQLNKTNWHLSWPAETTIEDTTIAQTACAAGLVSFTLVDFYSWIKDQKINWEELEYAEGAQRRMHKMIPVELMESFMSHFDLDKLKELAHPRKLIITDKTKKVEA